MTEAEQQPPPAAVTGDAATAGGDAEARYDAGIALWQAGRAEDALAAFAEAARLRPEWLQPLRQEADIRFERREWGRALALYRRLVELAPDWAAVRCRLAMTLRRLGQVEEALEHCLLGEALAPDNVALHLTKSHILLSLGRLAEGWQEFEWRWRIRGMQAWSHRLWDGRPLDGRTILVRGEQGIGDTIQFLRYLPLVAGRGGRVVLHTKRALRPLLVGYPGIAQVLDDGDAGAYHAQVPMMSLARLFGTTLETIPPPIAGFALPPAPVAAERVRAARRPRVGLVWAGNPEHKDDALRSCPLAAFAPVLAVPGVSFFALQKDIDAGALADAARIAPIVALGADLADTAAAILELDLVISVDTAIAHLAATLGKPTWLLLAAYADWRWLLWREDSPWYPSMRLFRQRVLGDWDDLMLRVAAALRALPPAGRQGGGPRSPDAPTAPAWCRAAE